MSEEFNLERDLIITNLKSRLNPSEQDQLDKLLAEKAPDDFKEFMSQPDPDFDVDDAVPGSKKIRMMVLKLAYLDFVRMLVNQQVKVEIDSVHHVNSIINQFEWLMGINRIPDSYRDKVNLKRIRKEYKVMLSSVGDFIRERRQSLTSSPSNFGEFVKQILGIGGPMVPDKKESKKKKRKK